MATPEQVARAHQRQQEAGWRRLGLRLAPEAAAALARLQRASGTNPGQVVTAALLAAAKRL